MKVILSLTAVFLTCNWLWDVSNNALRGHLTNGFWDLHAVAVNHAVWYLMIADVLLLAFYAIRLKETRGPVRIKLNHEELKTQ